ncbi:MAG TPA: RecX family transcriptional regulator [Longilinea sp.]|nr:RecX family transcriptional regulator [Longilinea sp.]
MDHTITALKTQKRNPNRINVYLDGEFAFGLNRLVAAWLKVGQVLSEAKVEALRKQDSEETAIEKALRFLGPRQRSQAEVEQRLAKYGYDAVTISAVVNRLKEDHLISDNDFAAMWVENRSTFRPRSHRMLKLELRHKGVDESVVQKALDQAKDDETLAYLAARKYATRLTNLDWQIFQHRLGAFLGRRGFSYETVRPVVKQVWDEVALDRDE